ncbi:MAG: hypothetical protein IKC20_00715 [Clostridia bacterium]|nr:hypothetical protein [Clostridia bacterium]
MDCYEDAVELFAAQNLAVDQQVAVDDAAELLYKARNDLEPQSLYFPDNKEHYETAKGWYNEISAYVQKTDVTRYGWEYIYVVDEETGESIKTSDIQQSENPLSSVTQSVYIYNGVTPEIEADIDEFRAKYASDNSTEDYNSLEAAQTLYNNIKAALTDPATGELYTVKKTNDETLIAGMKDLTENYIAGDWDGTTYTSTLLNQTQVEALNGKQGVEGLLPAAQKLITPATDATANFGGTLAYATNAIFNYTKNPATNLQFAEAMRKQVVDFLQLQFSLPVVPAANTFYTNAPATLYMFNQEQAAEFIDLIDDFLGNAANWPLIYEVNNLEVAQDTKQGSATNGVYNVEVWPSKTTVSNADGSTTNVSSGIGADKKIDDIFAQIGAQSTYYKQILLFTNNYYVDQLDWIIKNMFVEVDGETLILADLNGAADGSTQPYTDSLGNNITINYDVKKTAQGLRWYSEGYGYHTADNGRVYYLYTSNQTVLGSGKGSWFQDSFVTALQNMLGGTAYTAMQQRLGTKDYTSIGKIQDNAVATTNFTRYHLSQIETNGWSQTRQNNLYQSVNGDQSAISNAAIQIYNSIRNLKLLNATQAYRDVVNAYWSLQGKVYTWSNAQTFSPTSGTQGSLGYEVFYNMDENTFLKKIPQEKTFVEATATSPKYGTVTDAGLAERYSKAAYANGENNWYVELNNFYERIVGTTGTNILTIDKAAEVYSYGNDGVDSLYEEFVSIASQLKLDDFDRRWLDAIVDAFLTGNLDNLQSQDNKTLFAGLTGAPAFESTASESGNYYNASFYTTDSLKVFANILLTNNIVKDIYDDGELIPLSVPIDKLSNYKGQYFVTAQQIPADDLVTGTLIPELNSKLVLRAAETTELERALAATVTAYKNPALYVQDHVDENGVNTWDAFVAAYKAADAAKGNCDENVVGYYTAAEDQKTVDDIATALFEARSKIKERADASAPQVEVSVNTKAVYDFYTSDKKNDGDNETNAQQIANVDSVGAVKPATGTLFMPNNGGYSLIVYTNEVNPRILLQIEDIAEKLDDSTSIVASKHETISVTSQRTTGTTTNLIYGTVYGNGVIADITNRNLKKVDEDGKSGPLVDYENTTKSISDPTKNEADSSVFAILAPTFATNKATAAAIYKISVNDVVPQESGVLVEGNNYSNSLIVGNETVEDVTADDTITVYIYYHSSMAAGNDEGIFVNNEGKVALATPSYGATHVPSVLFEGELNYNGAWRNSVMLQRGFDSTVRSWEFMSIIADNKIGDVKNVAYTDPNFGEKNLGSFYYVLDKETDSGIYDVYEEGKDATGGLMDYDRATAAKLAMIDKINKMTDIEAFKSSKSFYVYGAEDAKGEYVNWAQSLNSKVENGDLVFVHVVDRWGNVVNRIIEVTNFDKKAPQVNSAASGAVSINEAGGSGIKDITVHNGDFSLGKFDYEINQSQKLTNGQVANNATVESADNTLTIKGLVPGKLYYIGAYDNAGNAGSTPVNASVEGKITLTITVEDDRVETGEEGSVASNSTTFTLNGTDTIILNSGEASSVIDASLEGNVFANRTIRHYITTKDNVTALKTVYQDGTVEEFTAETATVKDNGDGTLTWTIKRKLAEGEHKYKVYAKVNGGYENFYAPATINATTRTVKIECTNVGQGVTQLNFSGSLSFDIANYISKEVPYGTQVTISAKAYTTYEGCEFYYWINNTTDRIISTADVYEFKAVTNADYIAQFTNNSTCIDGKKFVVYVNNAKNVIERFELADGDSYTVPTGPVLPDYTFKGWSMTKAEVLASDKDTVIVEPIYELNASNTVTITEGNYTATGAGTYTAEANQRAVVTISTSANDGDGKEFLYWIDADTDEIVSYDRTYSFFCVKNTVLTPVYGDASAVQAEPIVRITEVKYNALSGKVSFFAERSVPEEFMILQTGIVVTKTESIGTNEEVFVVGGTSTAAGTSTSTANNGYYSANTVVATGQTVWARAYVIYETADGEIFEAYGPVVSYTVD